MFKNVNFNYLFLILVLSTSILELEAQLPKKDSKEIFNSTIDDVFIFNNMKLRVNDSVPLFIYNIDYKSKGNSYEEKARNYIIENKGLFKMTGSFDENLKLLSTHITASGCVVRFKQIRDGLDVDFNQIVIKINLDDFIVNVINGSHFFSKNVSTEGASTLLKSYSIVKKYLGINSDSEINFSDKYKMIHLLNSTPFVVNRIIIESKEFGDWLAFVDAKTGEILEIQKQQKLQCFSNEQKSKINQEKKERFFNGDNFSMLNSNPVSCSNGSGTIFRPDPLTSSGKNYGDYSNGGYLINDTGGVDDAQSLALTAELADVCLPNMTYSSGLYKLTNNKVVIKDFDAILGIQPELFQQASNDFSCDRDDDKFEAVMAFYYLNSNFDYVNGGGLGFSFQPNYPVQYDPSYHGPTGYGHQGGQAAIFFSKVYDGVDHAEDGPVIAHEFMHWLHDKTVTFIYVSDRTYAFAEGLALYWSQSFAWDFPGSIKNNILYPWYTNDFYYSLSTDLDYHSYTCDAGYGYYCDPFENESPYTHKTGQIIATVLMNIYNDIGKQKTDKIVLHGLDMLNGFADQEDAAEAFFQAAKDLNYSEEDLCIIFSHLHDAYYKMQKSRPGCCPGSDINIWAANVNYDQDMMVNGNIIVNKGAQLTISSKIEFPEGKSLIVKQGAKVIIDNGHLTKCSSSINWNGVVVEGNSMKGQPNYNSFPSDNEAGILIMKNNSVIEWAKIAISTNYHGSWTNQKWGGLVYCTNSLFQNNVRVAKFMKYDFTNKSKFLNCTFDGNSAISGATTGVTIWDTDGIEFNNCNFYNMKREGLVTYDCGATVINGNKFYHNKKGISTKSTFPFSSYLTIGSSNTSRNDFVDNRYHIYSYASAQREGLNIGFNDFDGSYKAIYLRGPSKYSIYSNNIYNSDFGIHAYRTGSMGNIVSKTVVDNNILTLNGIYFQFENHGLKFTCNDFACINDFTLHGINGLPGTIHSTQGNYWNPAGNCFTRPIVNTDIQTVGSTTPFKYRYYSTNCQNPQTVGNYTKSNSWHIPCQFSVAGSNQSYSYNDLEKVRKEIDKMKKDGNSEKLGEQLDKKDKILSSVVWDYVDAHKIDEAIKVLDSEKTDNTELMKYGIYVISGKLKNAERQLRMLPKSIVDLDDFVGVQQINLKRLQKDNYQMANFDSLYLERIAISNSASDIYARSILGLLFGREFEDKIKYERIWGVNSRSTNSAINDLSRLNVEIYPNPFQDLVTVSFKTEISVKNTEIRIIDLFGRIVYSKMITKKQEVIIDSSKWKRGIYSIQVRDKTGTIQFDSLIVKL